MGTLTRKYYLESIKDCLIPNSFLFKLKDIKIYHPVWVTGRADFNFHSKNERLKIKGLGPQSTILLPNTSLSLIKSYKEKVSGNFQTFIININTVYRIPRCVSQSF